MSTNNYVPRVTQLDALQLDEEVIGILKGQLLESLKYFSPRFVTPILPELELILRTLIFNFSLYKNGITFGQHMLSLKYDKTLLTRAKLHWFYCYTVILKYAKDRVLLSYTTNRRAQSYLSAIEKFQTVSDFVNLLRFLQTGRSPALVDYFLHLEVAPEKSISTRFTDYAWTRELLWHSFVEMLGFAAPLLNTTFIRRIIKQRSLKIIFRRKHSITSSFTNTTPIIKLTTKCAECGNSPILPHFMGCEHIFCHFCLQANKLDRPEYKCPRCSYYSANVIPVHYG